MKYISKSLFLLFAGMFVTTSMTGASDASLNSEEMQQIQPDSRLDGGQVTAGQSREINATRSIVVAGNDQSFTVEEDGSVILVAGKTITLLPGTKINPGGSLRASIHTIARKAGVVKRGELDATDVEMKQAAEQKIFSTAYTLFKPFPSPAKGTLHAGAEEQGSYSVLSNDLTAISPDTQRKVAITAQSVTLTVSRAEFSSIRNQKSCPSYTQAHYVVLRL